VSLTDPNGRRLAKAGADVGEFRINCSGSIDQRPLRFENHEPLEHDPEKCEAVFPAANAKRLRGDHAQTTT